MAAPDAHEAEPARPSVESRVATIDEALGTPGVAKLVRAPGRVNLIGDHTDYEDGLCMPVALDLDVLIGYLPAAAAVTVHSTDLGATARLPLGSSAVLDGSAPAWAATVQAAINELERSAFQPAGVTAAVSSTVPIGSGLSSSAAFTVATTLCLAEAADWPLAGVDLATAARRIEQHATGVPCGVLDHMASVFGRAGHALYLDCRTLEVEPVPIPDTVDLVVVHSGQVRELSSSAYAQRRQHCARAAARLGLRALRDARPRQVANDPRARHVVSENERVVRFAEAVSEADVEAMGRLMLESHSSLRDDFAVSTPELDRLVGALLDAGAVGARLTGAGFGGCVVAIAPSPRGAEVAREAVRVYSAATGLRARWWPVVAAAGAGPIERGDMDR